MKKFVKYTTRSLALLFGLLITIYAAIYIYVLANKKDIIRQIKEQAGETLAGDVQIGNIGLNFFSQFPRISVELEKVSIKDSLYNQHQHPFFTAEKVYARISLINVIQKNNPLNGIRVDNGQVYVYTDTTGYSNSYLFNPKKNNNTAGAKSKSETVIDDIKLRAVRLILDNRKQNKLFDFEVTKFNCDIKTTDSVLRLKTKNDILIHSLAFNTKLGSFAKESRFEGNLKLFFNKARKQLKFDDLDFTIKGHPFNISGNFDFSNAQSFALKITTNAIDYNFARSILTEKISTALSIVKMDKAIHQVSAEISGQLKAADPLVNAKWRCAETNISSPYANLSDCSFDGAYTNELIIGLPRKDPNSRLHLSKFTALWEGLNVNSQNIYIDNLFIPMVNCDIKTDFDHRQLNEFLQSSTIDVTEGKGVIDLTYSGPLNRNTNKNTLINGKFSLADGQVTYNPRNIKLKNVNGNIVFKNSDVFVTDFRGSVQGNKIIMNGSGKNLLALAKTNPGKVFIDWNIYSPSLDLADFTSLLKKRTVIKRKSSKSSLGNNIDELVTQANFQLDVKTDELLYKKFKASNVKASVALINENWKLNQVSLQHAGGSMIINGYLNEKNSKYYESDIKVNMANVDINKVMYAFNNFGQDGIEAENLRGKLTSQADVRMLIDRDLETPSNLSGFVDFSLKNGQLMHYEPLRKIQNVVFKKRNFDNIQFAELKNRFDIKDRDITINRMEIQSSVLTLFVEGVYSLRGNTDISIQVPLSNIKKRDENYQPENKGAKSKGGASIFVRGKPGDDGNIEFKIDLFRKLRKKDRSDKEDPEKKSR